MNKNELILEVHLNAELTKKDAAKAVNAVFEAIEVTLKKGDFVKVDGFGKFEVRERAARKGRNPQTGEEIEIAASKVPVLVPFDSFKNKFNPHKVK